MSEQQISKLAGVLVEHQRHFGEMSTKDRQWVIQNTEVAIGLFAKAVKNRDLVKEQKINNKFLSPHGLFTVSPPTEPFNPHKFFKTSTDLWVSGDFVARILSVANCVESADGTSLSSFGLVNPANDSEIRSELSKNHLIELWQIAEIISLQPNGKEGNLLNNGYANIFYVRGKNGDVFAVSVGWSSDVRQWRVDAWRLGGLGRWDDGFRVFSRN